MKVAPCSRHSPTKVSPVQMPYPVSRSKKLPLKSWLELIGRPTSRSPSPMPISNGTSRLPIDVHQVQVRCQRGLSDLSL